MRERALCLVVERRLRERRTPPAVDDRALAPEQTRVGRDRPQELRGEVERGVGLAAGQRCTIGRAIKILGERSTFVVLCEVFNRRFDDMRSHTGIPRQVLTNRLALLLERGVLRKEPYRLPGDRTRHEYRLTPMRLDLYPVLVAVAARSERHLADPEGPPVEFRHRDCGGRVGLALTCEHDHPVENLRAVVTAPGPGARPG